MTESRNSEGFEKQAKALFDDSVEQLDAAISTVVPSAERDEDVWEAMVAGWPVLIIADTEADRMRIIVPICETDELTGDRCFRLLGIIYPLKPIELIFSNLNSSTASTRSNAVEVLDNLLDKDIKRALLPLIDDMPRDRVLERGQELYSLQRKKPEAWVAEFLNANESWLVSVALYVVAELGLKEHAARIEEHLDHPDPVTRETALLSLRVLLPIDELKARGVAIP